MSSAECRVHLVSVNRLSACRNFFWVHSWQNGTRCRDGVNVLWCCSHLVWLVFEGSIPTCACFPLENFFVTCSCWFFFFLELYFRNGKREERWKGKMHNLESMKIYNCVVHKEKRIIINSKASK